MSSSVNRASNEKVLLITIQGICVLGRSGIALDKLARITAQVYEKTANVVVTISGSPKRLLESSFVAHVVKESDPSKGSLFIATAKEFLILSADSLSDEEKNKDRTIARDGCIFNQVESIHCSVVGSLVRTDECDARLLQAIKNVVKGLFPKVSKVVISKHNMPVTASNEKAGG